MSLWTREEVTILIEEYRKFPNLYNPKSINYKNRNLRRRALNSVLEALKGVKPTVSIPEIQTKFQALKQNATKERKKWLESQKSGSATEEISEPSLWYYELITFIFDCNEPRRGIDSIDFDEREDSQLLVIEDDVDPTAEEPELIDENLEENRPSTSTSSNAQLTPTRCLSTSSGSSAPAKKKRKGQEQEDTILGELSKSMTSISKHLTENATQDHEETSSKKFGDYIVAKLEKISDEDIRDEVEVEIINIVNRALKKCRNAQNQKSN